ncbi:alpha/beta hydrolase [Algisphaera agarilytica]|uniref:Pimeloyl-ACP methyl ester carboxylesterase n=1 Tax=Algisphaera agarilytica TaxID=1385975 RepID=A0A7X0H394_9BACT|nr:alpha/beta hydrolase [Algisphaera agarilytica]MBB6428483.1 pimeloyl-ACP methyl ester carboxylesterase [Algisphaera agarilytica]
MKISPPSLIALAIAPLIALSWPAPSAADPTPVLNQPYVENAADRQTLDIYPASEQVTPDQPKPAIIFIHGGGWMRGDKQSAARFADTFTESGIHVISLGYRLVPDVAWPENARDLAAGVDWVFRHAQELDIDPQRITLMGHSAGAHLAAVLGADARWLAEHDQSPARLRSVVLLDGAGYHIPNVIAEKVALRPELYSTAFGNDPEGWADASPALNVSPDEGCGTWVSIINDDREVSHHQSGFLFEALRQAGHEDTTLLPVKESHRDVALSLGNPDDPEALYIIELAKSPRP